MKKNNIFKVVLITLIVIAILTWILPSTAFDSTSVINGGKLQVGIFDFFNYFMMTATSYYGTIYGNVPFGYVPVYILAIGGFYGVLYQISGYRKLLDKIVQKYKGNEWIYLTIVMIILAVITSVSGLSVALLFIFPFVITTILLMGYSKITSLLVTVGSVCVGLIGTTYSILDVEAINYYLGLTNNNEIVTKLIILVVSLIVLIVNVLMYAKKHKIDEPRKGFLYPEVKNSKAKIWPMVLVFDLILFIMILSFMSWTDMFNVTFFSDALAAIKEFTINGFPIFDKLLGSTILAFGEWQFTELSILLIVFSGFVAILYKVKFDDVIKGFCEGVKKAVMPAIILTMIYTLFFISYPISFTIVKPILELTDTFNVVTTTIAGIVSNFLSVDIYASSSDILPYISYLFKDETIYSLVGLIWQSAYGLTLLFVPTSVILAPVLAYLNVSYFKWLKAIWKILLELLVVLLVIFLIVLMI